MMSDSADHGSSAIFAKLAGREVCWELKDECMSAENAQALWYADADTASARKLWVLDPPNQRGRCECTAPPSMVPIHVTSLAQRPSNPNRALTILLV